MSKSQSDMTLKIGDLHVHVCRKKIKGIYLSISRTGKVRLSAPYKVSDAVLKSLVFSKLDWVTRRRAQLLEAGEQRSFEYVSGEAHYFFGREYKLKIVSSTTEKPRVVIENDACLQLYIRPGASVKVKEETMYSFYRDALRKYIPELVAKWAAVMGVRPHEVLLKRMKTRWGSCVRSKGRIWLNVELAKCAPCLLEYVFVHEMVHFFVKGHGEQFKSLMTTFLPPWRQYKRDLKSLAYL